MATADGDRSLASWNDGPARAAIQDFVARVATEGSPEFVPPAERVAVFDNDGTLWCEKPMPIELGFILQRLAGMAEQDPALRDRQPWKAAYDKDYAWLGQVITKHYHGDDSDVKVLMGGILQAFAGMTVEDYEAAADALPAPGAHPTLGRAFHECGYRPMVELLRYLEANGFTTYIASGGDRDFMRPVTEAIYGIPPERVIGSSNALRYDAGRARRRRWPTWPSRTSSTTGRSSRCASGAGSGAGRSWPAATPTATSRCCSSPAGRPGPALRLLVLHDDPEREFDYVAGAERALERGRGQGLDGGQREARLGDRVRRGRARSVDPVVGPAGDDGPHGAALDHGGEVDPVGAGRVVADAEAAAGERGQGYLVVAGPDEGEPGAGGADPDQGDPRVEGGVGADQGRELGGELARGRLGGRLRSRRPGRGRPPAGREAGRGPGPPPAAGQGRGRPPPSRRPGPSGGRQGPLARATTPTPVSRQP